MVDDRIHLSRLRLRGIHGVDPEEREAAQEFLVDIECPIDAARAAAADDVAATLDYRRLRDIAADVIAGPPRALIEALAEEIARRVLDDVAVPWVRVRVTKPRPGTIEGEASVEIRRERRR